MEERPNIYKVKVGDEERKAIDLLVLKEFLDRKRFEYNLLDIDLTKVENNVSVITIIAKAQKDLLLQLEHAIDTALGLTEEEQTEQSPVAVEPPKEVPQPKYTPKPQPQQKPEPEDKSERIIL